LSESIRKVTLRFNQPYIFSLCGSKDERTRRNGLLSQWRAYGRDGAYALVFDTKALESRLADEAKNFHYQHVQWGDVYYYDHESESTTVASEISDAEDVLRAGVLDFLGTPTADAMQSAYESVTTLSCLYKHWGFHEENEVRIIAIPAHSSVRLATAAEGRTVRIPRTFVRDGSPVPYIELFAAKTTDDLRIPLPITRVIVGPHRDKMQRKEAVELILSELGLDAEVEVSEIPYTGR